MNFLINTLGILFLLIGLEIVLGVDNLLIITLLVDPLSPKERQRARVIGLLLALLFRMGFVIGAFWLTTLTKPVLGHFSARDFLLLLGGLFLIGKASQELALMVVSKKEKSHFSANKKVLVVVILQIVLLDLLFSIDSVITAVGLTSHLATILIAVIFSFALLLWYVGPIGEFILNNPSLKILALSFLVLIGLAFVSDACGFTINNALIYSTGVFAFAVELLQAAYRKKTKKADKETRL